MMAASVPAAAVFTPQGGPTHAAGSCDAVCCLMQIRYSEGSVIGLQEGAEAENGPNTGQQLIAGEACEEVLCPLLEHSRAKPCMIVSVQICFSFCSVPTKCTTTRCSSSTWCLPRCPNHDQKFCRTTLRAAGEERTPNNAELTRLDKQSCNSSPIPRWRADGLPRPAGGDLCTPGFLSPAAGGDLAPGESAVVRAAVGAQKPAPNCHRPSLCCCTNTRRCFFNHTVWTAWSCRPRKSR